MKMVIGKIRDKPADIKLVPGQSLIIGRSNVADYLLHDSAVSSRHASLVCDANSVLLTDLGSRNGTFVNETQIKQIELSHSDKVRIGTCVFRVSMSDGRKKVAKQKTERTEQSFPAPDSTLAVKEPPTEVKPIEVVENEGFASEGSMPFGMFPRSDSGPSPGFATAPSAPIPRAPRPTQIDARKHPDLSERYRVVVDYFPPECDGDRIVLNAGQDVSFGKSGVADFAIKDSNLSDLHFRISLVGQDTVLTDNRSKFGTYLNGQQIKKAELTDGDEILAGRTKFKIALAGVKTNEQSGSILTDREIVAVDVPAPKTSAPKRVVDRKTFDTGLVMLGQEKVALEEIDDLIVELAKLGPTFFIVDFVRIAQPLPEDFEAQSSMLFDWIPESAAIQSPHLIAMEQLENWQKLVSIGWGCDGLMLLHSQSDANELVGKIRKMVRGSNQKGNFGGAINGICWPSVLGNILKNNVDDFASSFCSEVDHVFLETMGGDGWQLFAEKKHADRIVRESRMDAIDPEPEPEPEPDEIDKKEPITMEIE